MSMQYIRDYYDVPAKKGGRVRYFNSHDEGTKFCEGTITGTHNAHIMVLFDGNKKPVPCHPTWHIEYMELKHNDQVSA